MDRERGRFPRAYDLYTFPSEQAEGKPWATVRVRVWLGSVLALSGAFAVTLWFVVNQPDPGLPQVAEVKATTPLQTADPNEKWLTPLLLPLALQGFDGPIPAESARVTLRARMPAATPAAPRSPAIVPAGPVALTEAAANVSPVATLAGSTPVSIGLSAPSLEIAARSAAVVAPPPSTPTETVTPYRSALPEPTIAPPTAPVAQVDQRVYDTESPDVVPPVPFDAKALPSKMVAGNAVAQNRMELLIGITGRVEEVRMASRPARMSDMMMLSSAKNWVFTPATKDGKPVRYRLPVTWTVTQ